MWMLLEMKQALLRGAQRMPQLGRRQPGWSNDPSLGMQLQQVALPVGSIPFPSFESLWGVCVCFLPYPCDILGSSKPATIVKHLKTCFQ